MQSDLLRDGGGMGMGGSGGLIQMGWIRRDMD